MTDAYQGTTITTTRGERRRNVGIEQGRNTVEGGRRTSTGRQTSRARSFSKSVQELNGSRSRARERGWDKKVIEGAESQDEVPKRVCEREQGLSGRIGNLKEQSPKKMKRSGGENVEEKKEEEEGDRRE
jgi:hypothetical protein